MERDPSLLLDITVALSIALAAGFLASRLRLSSLVGYIVAGVVISPFTPGFVGNVTDLRLIADIGIVLLLFSIGVQFQVSDLRVAGGRMIGAAVAQVGIVFGITVAIATAIGWSRDASFYLAAATTSSSSVVLVRLLETRGETSSEAGRRAVGWSIVQDLAAVVLVAVIGSMVGGGGSGLTLVGEGAGAIVKALAFVAGTLFIGLRIVPVVLGVIAEQRSRELFFLSIAALVIGTAFAAEWTGLSLALGAFLAGLIVSESDLSYRVLGELLPTRDVFAVLFFVSAGMLVDPSVIGDEWPKVLVLAAIIILIKPLVIGGLLVALRRPLAVSALSAVLLMPAAEFSFVFAGEGLNRSVLNEHDFAIVVAATVLSIVISPAAAAGMHRLVRREPMRVAAPAAAPSRIGRHAVVAGYDGVGALVARMLAARFEVTVLVDDARLARGAREAGLTVIEGTPSSGAVLARARLGDARVLVVALDDPFAARLVTERAHVINPYLDIVGRAVSPGQATTLRASGASRAVVANDEIALELARHSLVRFGVSSQEVTAMIAGYRARLSDAQG